MVEWLSIDDIRKKDKWIKNGVLRKEEEKNDVFL